MESESQGTMQAVSRGGWENHDKHQSGQPVPGTFRINSWCVTVSQ